MQEHKDKLAENKANPDKFGNKGFLKNAPLKKYATASFKVASNTWRVKLQTSSDKSTR